jgi:hypothetical protein
MAALTAAAMVAPVAPAAAVPNGQSVFQWAWRDSRGGSPWLLGWSRVGVVHASGYRGGSALDEPPFRSAVGASPAASPASQHGG